MCAFTLRSRGVWVSLFNSAYFAVSILCHFLWSLLRLLFSDFATACLLRNVFRLQRYTSDTFRLCCFVASRNGDHLFVLPSRWRSCPALNCNFVGVKYLLVGDDGLECQCLGMCGSGFRCCNIFKVLIQFSMSLECYYLGINWCFVDWCGYDRPLRHMVRCQPGSTLPCWVRSGWSYWKVLLTCRAMRYLPCRFRWLVVVETCGSKVQCCSFFPQRRLNWRLYDFPWICVCVCYCCPPHSAAGRIFNNVAWLTKFCNGARLQPQ